MLEKAVAGVAGLPQGSNANGCDREPAPESPAETPANPAECRTFGPDPYIAYSLAQVRWLRRLKGQLPSFRRGKMYWDFRTNRVRILCGPAVAVAFACGVVGLALLFGSAA